MHFQDLILNLQKFWAEKGCLLIQPYDLEKGAATFNPATFLRSLGPEPFFAAWADPCRRPTDGRYGDNPLRLQHYYQFQVVMKPSPLNFQDLYLESLKAISIDPRKHDIRFVHDDWESPTLGAWGLGWEVWIDGVEATQFTYFQQVGGFDVKPVVGEITYGLERLCLFLQGKNSIFDLSYNDKFTYGDLYHDNEVQFSTYNFEYANVPSLQKQFAEWETEVRVLCEKGLPMPAADLTIKASHAFNLLDARGAISVNERQQFILRVREMARLCAAAWMERREKLGFPLLSRIKPATHAAKESEAAATNLPERAPLLLELGVEELPSRVIPPLMEQLPKLFAKHIGELGLAAEDVKYFVTPRRIAISVGSILTKQPDMLVEKKGMPLKQAKDEKGNYTQAAEGFARKQGITVDQLEIREVNGEKFIYSSQRKMGENATAVLAKAVPAMFNEIHWYKTMRWENGEHSFVRPVRWLVALLGNSVVPMSYCGIAAGRKSMGHRVLCAGDVTVDSDRANYLEALRKASVYADPKERRKHIWAQIADFAKANGLEWIPAEELLDEVVNINEFPVAVECAFPPEYLDLPESVLTTEMRVNQRFFSFRSTKTGKMDNRFLGIANILPENNDFSLIRAGYEKVIVARFKDAAFFLREDAAIPLRDRYEGLSTITFQRELGSMRDRVDRIAALADKLAKRLGWPQDKQTKLADLVHVCKCDLSTHMVFEFPELQGEIGSYYAEREGYDPVVAKGIREHYLPKGAEDELPSFPEAALAAISDRLDTLAGFFAIGKPPKATADPYSLRRACIGILRILTAQDWDLSIDECLAAALDGYPKQAPAANRPKLEEDMAAFFNERLKRLVLDNRLPNLPEAIDQSLLDSLLSRLEYWRKPAYFQKRLSALSSALGSTDTRQIAQTAKRVSRIIDLKAAAGKVDPALFAQPEEGKLYDALRAAAPQAQAAAAKGDYLSALKEMYAVNEPARLFFDAVLVNAPETAVKANRHALLKELLSPLDQIADFSKLSVGDA